MSLQQVPIESVLAEGAPFDALIDVRSPAEFADDHLPGAVNWPVLDDEERARVGTIYKQVSTFEARKVGGAIVSRRIGEILAQHVADKPKDWRPLVYCWRGGQRSGSLSIVLAQVGFKTSQLAGGYRAFRGVVHEQLGELPARFDFRVLCGRTGSAKTRLLQALAAEGAQVLDLEGLAAHRGSVLGHLPDQPQPSQKRFERELWQVLRGLDPARPVFVESESRRIGQRHVPEALLVQMREARPLRVEMPLAARCEFLAEDYDFFIRDAEALCARLVPLIGLQSRATVESWQAWARAGAWDQLLPALLTEHYDPLYDRSSSHHFSGFDTAPVIALDNAHGDTLRAAARQWLA